MKAWFSEVIKGQRHAAKTVFSKLNRESAAISHLLVVNRSSLSVSLTVAFCLTEGICYAAKCPCDIYDDAQTPCVAAHSTVRALYSAYNGPLYQVQRQSDNEVKDIGVLTPGGFANTAAQDSFLSSTTGTIPKIYDQSPQHNDLLVSPKCPFLNAGGIPANATDGMIMVGGHKVYGIYVTGNPDFIATGGDKPIVAYRLNTARGLATGDQAESIYEVFDGNRYSDDCCFGYGNASTNGNNNGDASMEALYWGSCGDYSRGGGNGPWILADLENGMYAGDGEDIPSNTPITGWSWVTGMLKGPSGNHMTLKAGNAQSGKLVAKWDGARPPGYAPKRLEGAIILGTGGDGSSGGTGTFYEGAITIGNPPDSIDDAVQANIVAAGYGDSEIRVSVQHNAKAAVTGSMFKVQYDPSRASATIVYTLDESRHVSIGIFNQQGKRVNEIAGSIESAGDHEVVYDFKQTPAGLYIWRIALDGRDVEAGKMIMR
jgi:hypothetical protein